jgi:hypothetical protein
MFGNMRIWPEENRRSGTIMTIQSYMKNSANTLKKNLKEIWFFTQMNKNSYFIEKSLCQPPGEALVISRRSYSKAT